jgi:RNA-directed DNA polymerase
MKERKEMIMQLVKNCDNLKDFCELINSSNLLVSKIQSQKPLYTSGKQFGYLLANKEHLYKQFDIPKKSGGRREINAPLDNLKVVQYMIKNLLQLFYNTPFEWQEKLEEISKNNATVLPCVHGFVNGRGIVSNAYLHLKQDFVLNFDLKDFFPSIGNGKIIETLCLAPFNFSRFTSKIIANLCTLENHLPQGACTSPLLSNIVSQRMDNRFMSLANKYPTMQFSRYADDITFSCMYHVFDDSFMEIIEDIVRAESYVINPKKTRLQRQSQRQEVTGLIVNERLNIPRKKIRMLRAVLHNWKVNGYESAQAKFKDAFGMKKDLKLSIGGFLNFLKMVRGDQDALYQKYYEEFKILTNEITN